MVISPETKQPDFPNATDYHNKDTEGYYLSSYVNRKIFVRESFH